MGEMEVGQLEDFADDPSIEDDEALWRRVYPGWLVPDENLGGIRLSSAAFQDSSDGSPMSVLIEKIVTLTQRTPADILRGYDNYSLCSVMAGFARKLEQKIATRPIDLDEPAHGFMVGRKSPRIKKELAKAAIWVIPPT